MYSYNLLTLLLKCSCKTQFYHVVKMRQKTLIFHLFCVFILLHMTFIL